MKDSKLQKASEFSEPDNIMMLSNAEFEDAYDSDYGKEVDIDTLESQMMSLETEINDLLFHIDDLTRENEDIDYMLNNEFLDYFRAAELTEERTYNNIRISELEQKLDALKKQYTSLESKKNAKYGL